MVERLRWYPEIHGCSPRLWAQAGSGQGSTISCPPGLSPWAIADMKAQEMPNWSSPK